MNMRKIILMTALAPLAFVAACGSDETPPPATTGEQLRDLQDAYESRAITPEEYKEEKERILDQ